MQSLPSWKDKKVDEHDSTVLRQLQAFLHQYTSGDRDEDEIYDMNYTAVGEDKTSATDQPDNEIPPQDKNTFFGKSYQTDETLTWSCPNIIKLLNVQECYPR